jgi:hypothetical protein
MPPPSKRIARFRAIASERWSAPLNQLTQRSEPECSSDDDIYMIDSDPEIDDEHINRVEKIILKWTDSARPKRPAVYVKDSRTTKWQRKKEQAQRAASAAKCHPITHFLPKISENCPSSEIFEDCPSESSIDEEQGNLINSHLSVGKSA